MRRERERERRREGGRDIGTERERNKNLGGPSRTEGSAILEMHWMSNLCFLGLGDFQPYCKKPVGKKKLFQAPENNTF